MTAPNPTQPQPQPQGQGGQTRCCVRTPCGGSPSLATGSGSGSSFGSSSDSGCRSGAGAGSITGSGAGSTTSTHLHLDHDKHVSLPSAPAPLLPPPPPPASTAAPPPAPPQPLPPPSVAAPAPAANRARRVDDRPRPRRVTSAAAASSSSASLTATTTTNTTAAVAAGRPPLLQPFRSSSVLPTITNSTAVSSGIASPARSRSASIWGFTYANMAQTSSNLHQATDLLKHAMLHSHRPSDDGDIDQVHSTSTTPPGAATPRPDLTQDKRLPGILHTYFGQVRDSSASNTSSSALHLQDTPLPRDTSAPTQLPCPSGGANGPTMSADDIPTAPTTPEGASAECDKPVDVDVDTDADADADLAPLLPHERVGSQPAKGASAAYPTPPMSSNSSVRDASPEAAPDRPEGDRPSLPARVASQDSLSGGFVPLPSSRKQTLTSPSPLSVVTASAQISNPANDLRSQTSPSSPIVAALSASRRQSLSRHSSQGRELTERLPRNQNTPPQTPRTRSHEGRQPNSASRSTSRGGAGQEAAAGPILGKLTVVISEGRGLRPSIDPYVVCQFQQAEFISEGPRNAEDGTEEAVGAVPMARAGSDMGRPRAIPMRSRQSSHTGAQAQDLRLGRTTSRQVSEPVWNHEAIFDVVGQHAELEITVYDRSDRESFLGHVRFCPALTEHPKPYDGWFPLEPLENDGNEKITGEIHLQIGFKKTEKKHYGPEDFSILKMIGKGTFGQVFQVRKKDTSRIYAMKVLSKKVIVQKKEVAHTLGERNILVRTAMADSPFIVGLKFSFQTPSDLYLVTDYMSGGELFWHLQKEGRFQEHRAKFYIAELILALQHLHEHDIVYRDLKPENILLDANGHIALCDFGLSKANLVDNATTNTFCGTTEYLAPEVLLDEHGYTKMVDFWSLGVLVFEMCCGWSPFYAEDTQQMYKNIAFGKVRFPRDALSTEGRNFVKGLLNRNPKHRLGANGDAQELKEHPFFADIDWEALSKKNVVPPFKPILKGELDVSNFDPEFTNALNGGAGSLNARAAALASGVNPASTPLSPTVQANFKGFTFVDESAMEKQFGNMSTDDDDARNDDRMEEDEQDKDWEIVNRNRADRMSGVVPSSTTMGPGEHDDTAFRMD